MGQKFIKNQIEINAPAAKVWEALINPELTRQYMFGCEVICDWQIGHSILWKGAKDGVTYVKGDLVAFDPKKKFSFTVFDPNAEYPDIPDNYLTATYTLSDQGSTTLLQVIQGDYATVADGNKRYQDTEAQGGWRSVLEAIKQLVEK